MTSKDPLRVYAWDLKNLYPFLFCLFLRLEINYRPGVQVSKKEPNLRKFLFIPLLYSNNFSDYFQLIKNFQLFSLAKLFVVNPFPHGDSEVIDLTNPDNICESFETLFMDMVNAFGGVFTSRIQKIPTVCGYNTSYTKYVCFCYRSTENWPAQEIKSIMC